MKHFRFSRFLLTLLFVFAFMVPVSFIVMALWNNILVPVLHVSIIDFWQALGIFALSKILFGGFPGRPGWGKHGFRRREMQRHQPASCIVNEHQQRTGRRAVLEPPVITAVDLDQLAQTRTPVSRLVKLRRPLFARNPQPGLTHPAPHGFLRQHHAMTF